jgi:hypothetical protein
MPPTAYAEARAARRGAPRSAAFVSGVRRGRVVCRLIEAGADGVRPEMRGHVRRPQRRFAVRCSATRLDACSPSGAGCVIGRDYPEPIVDHKRERERAMARYRAVSAQQQESADRRMFCASPPSRDAARDPAADGCGPS